MQTKDGFILLSPAEFADWIKKQSVTRTIKLIQLHHTWSPSYKHFKGNNHFSLQSGMRASHKARGFSDIAQQFTIFPDGMICTGRSLNTNPAGIKGANTGAVCIEILGNFDTGGDTMTGEQQGAVIQAVRLLLERFKLDHNAITYHCWWTASGKSLGDYASGKSAKTCPGTAFFGGNTKAAFINHFIPRLKGEDDMTDDRVREILIEVLTGSGIGVPNWAEKEWDAAQEIRITDGTRPEGYAKRDEVASMIMRAIRG